MIKLIDIFNEIKVNKPYGKLKAFINPSGAIYLIFKGKPTNSSLKNYVVKVGHLYEKTGEVGFELAEHTIEEFKNVLDRLNIPYQIDKEYNEVYIDNKIFNFKKIDKYSIYDEDVEKENWFNNININEIKVNNPTPFNLDFVKNNFQEILDITCPQMWSNIKKDFTKNKVKEEDGFIILDDRQDNKIFLTDKIDKFDKGFGEGALIPKKTDIKGKTIYYVRF